MIELAPGAIAPSRVPVQFEDLLRPSRPEACDLAFGGRDLAAAQERHPQGLRAESDRLVQGANFDAGVREFHLLARKRGRISDGMKIWCRHTFMAPFHGRFGLMAGTIDVSRHPRGPPGAGAAGSVSAQPH